MQDNKGGGLHAIGSSIEATSEYKYSYTGARLHFTENEAEMGGGLSLEANAKLYVLKRSYIIYYILYRMWRRYKSE